MTGPAIDAIGLVKEFEKGRRTVLQRLRREPDRRERFRAVDGIDLRVERGEIFGVLGPNGAGKTTTMRMLATLLEPTGGGARVKLGFDDDPAGNDVQATGEPQRRGDFRLATTRLGDRGAGQFRLDLSRHRHGADPATRVNDPQPEVRHRP